MTQLWPAGLPFFNRMDGHSRTGAQGAVIRTPMDAGPGKARRRSTASPRGYSGQIPWLDKQQFATFETFVSQTIADGALPFEVEDPWDGLTKTFRMVGDPPYTASPAGTGMQVTAELEIVARPAQATVAIAASILGNPAQVFSGDVLYASPAVYAGESGRFSHEWYRVSTGDVIGTSDTLTIRDAWLFDAVGYRTRALNGPISTATAQPKVMAVPPADVLFIGTQAVISGSRFVVAEMATVMVEADTVMVNTNTVVVPA